MPKLYKKAVHTLQNEGLSSFLNKTKNKIVDTYKKATFKPYIITKSVSDESFQFLISDLFAKSWYDRPHAWPELVWVKENAIVEGDIVADCGAHHGLTGLLFAKCVGSTGEVIGFEALPKNVTIALENIRLNKAKNFEVRNFAVGSHKGDTKFLVYSNGSVGERDDMEVVTVPMIALDEAFISKKPTFLKIDVEGYEIEVLKGAKEILKTLPKLDIEIHCFCFKEPVGAVEELLSLLPLANYQAYIQLLVDGSIVPYNPGEHTPQLIAKHDVVHFFALPKKNIATPLGIVNS
ncbi:FkbM family methyltransferase [Trichocoleus sp. FACHB-90]|uniref:FkbM family methyltransferase n=1 Tax=Cyanophyceae TaxID=3028117 RepID=UPI0016895B28|nr:FkbM family methyltransferase [Trichocoleus sp. FACHB-90]MBD1925829.1 FkbM family methyltransferase [Trichocoleus sp. FACHB-90]